MGKSFVDLTLLFSCTRLHSILLIYHTTKISYSSDLSNRPPISSGRRSKISLFRKNLIHQHFLRHELLLPGDQIVQFEIVFPVTVPCGRNLRYRIG